MKTKQTKQESFKEWTMVTADSSKECEKQTYENKKPCTCLKDSYGLPYSKKAVNNNLKKEGYEQE